MLTTWKRVGGGSTKKSNSKVLSEQELRQKPTMPMLLYILNELEKLLTK